MQRIFVGFAAIAAVALAAGLSADRAPGQGAVQSAASDPLRLRLEERNPWTNLTLNNQPRDFQFAIVTDRTGGHRPGVFAEAVRKLNLLQPEFVISVGDLIEGYTEDNGQWAIEWAEFEGKVQQLQMPFFYVGGNHDLTNPGMTANWKRKFGRTYYEFRYHDVLFVALNSEDPPKVEPLRISPEQQRWFADVLARNEDVRWTFVFLHKPAWVYADDDPGETGWAGIERALGARKATVFAGHVHNYARYERNGREYFSLATTGGSSRLRGKEAGEFDHIVWVTMKDRGPVIANLMLDGIEDKNLRTLPEPKPTGKKRAAQ